MPKIKRVRKGNASSRRTVPYARGFHPPSPKKRLEAIGSGQLAREYDPTSNFFKEIPKPTSIDDWLAQYNETGQTYKQFLRECPWLSNRKLKYIKNTFVPSGSSLPQKYPGAKIYLLPLGEFDTVSAPGFSDLAEYAQLFLSLPVEVLPPVKLEVDKDIVYWVDTSESRELGRHEGATRRSRRTARYRLDSRFDDKSGHYQLNVSSLLLKLKQSIPNNALCLVALTMADLYEASTDLFVAGMAAWNHCVGVFSFCRYNPTLTFSTEFWHKLYNTVSMATEEQRRLVLQRSCKLLVHEISHLLGIDHCIWYSCCMNGSGHLSEDFEQSMHLCPVDLHKLQTLCNFDVVERYKTLLTFFEKHKMAPEAEWVRNRIGFITKSI